MSNIQAVYAETFLVHWRDQRSSNILHYISTQICLYFKCNLQKQWRCSVKKMFLKILQYSQTCNFMKKRLYHRCFLVNVAKFLKIIILKILRMAASGPTSLYFNTILLCSVKIRQKYFKGINHCPSHSD